MEEDEVTKRIERYTVTIPIKNAKPLKIVLSPRSQGKNETFEEWYWRIAGGVEPNGKD